jgi:hydroxyacyl-ACP dehydratase HTD2-like protein with hotdog domain
MTGNVTDDAPGETDAQYTIATAQVQPREVDLFMFSAASWLTHRIHFDRDYARREGFRDLVIHGPMQGAYLANLLSGAVERVGGRLTELYFRHHQPAYCAEQLSLRAVLKSVVEQDGAWAVGVEVSIRNAEQAIVTSGRATLRVADQAQVSALLRPDEATP